MGLILVLAEAVQAINAAGITQSVFLDDRVLTAPTVRQLLKGKQLWSSWSQRLGLVENENKITALAHNSYQRHALLRHGFHPAW